MRDAVQQWQSTCLPFVGRAAISRVRRRWFEVAGNDDGAGREFPPWPARPHISRRHRLPLLGERRAVQPRRQHLGVAARAATREAVVSQRRLALRVVGAALVDV